MALLDVLTGLLGLILLLVLDFRTPIKFDLRWFFTVGAAFCCGLGFLRSQGGRGNPWMKGAWISCGFVVPLLILSLTSMGLETGIVITFVGVASASICFGSLARKKWSGNKRTAVAILLLPLACVVLTSFLMLPRLMEKWSGDHVNLPSPTFSLADNDGRVLTSAELRGKVVVLAFWATWCEPCWQELPRVATVYSTYHNNRSVLFYAVNAQAEGDTVETARAFAKKMRLVLPVAYTENANATRLGVDGYPTLIVLDADGRMRFIHHGYDASERLESVLTREIGDLLDHR